MGKYEAYWLTNLLLIGYVLRNIIGKLFLLKWYALVLKNQANQYKAFNKDHSNKKQCGHLYIQIFLWAYNSVMLRLNAH